MGGTGFSKWEILEVLGADSIIGDNWDKPGGPFMNAYRKGFLLAELKLRERIFTDAGHGSSPAQALAKKILDDAKFKNEIRS